MNPILLTILISALGAQLIKTIIYSVKYKTLHPMDLITTGGMPSSHSAIMSGLTFSIYLYEGPTTAFYAALAVTLVILVDAVGVRRTAGEEGLIIHKLISKTKLHIREPHFSMGHTPLQVAAGTLFGLGVAAIVWLIP